MIDATIVSSPNQGRVKLAGIDPSAFQHPLDQQATAQLRKLKGFDSFTAKFLELGFERIDYFLNLASNVRVGTRQFPRLYGMLQEACEVLDVPEPELYVSQGQGVNAGTSGHTNPYIIVQAELLDLMDDDEVMGVLGHELGHVKCGHVLFQMMARFIGIAGAIIGDMTLGIGSLLTAGIEMGLMTWQRRAELSADRAALLVMQDARPCVSMLMKLAGGVPRFASEMNAEEFLNQARAYNATDQGLSSKIYRFLAGTMQTTHPFAIERAKELNEWIDSAAFEQILAGNYPRMAVQAQSGYCPSCGNAVHPSYKFCAVCGQAIST